MLFKISLQHLLAPHNAVSLASFFQGSKSYLLYQQSTSDAFVKSQIKRPDAVLDCKQRYSTAPRVEPLNMFTDTVVDSHTWQIRAPNIFLLQAESLSFLQVLLYGTIVLLYVHLDQFPRTISKIGNQVQYPVYSPGQFLLQSGGPSEEWRLSIK